MGKLVNLTRRTSHTVQHPDTYRHLVNTPRTKLEVATYYYNYIHPFFTVHTLLFRGSSVLSSACSSRTQCFDSVLFIFRGLYSSPRDFVLFREESEVHSPLDGR